MKTAKHLLLRFFILPMQRLVGFFMRNVVTRLASKDDVPLLERLFWSVEVVAVSLEDRIRQLRFSGRTVLGGRPSLQTYLREDRPPWDHLHVNAITMPGMISDEVAKYYEYIGSEYQGHGEAVELGPWLGKSTRHIIRGLNKNPKFVGKQLYVFDDFVWRLWMNPFISDDQRLPNHSDFCHLFEKYVRDIRPHLNVIKGKIVDYDGNENVAPIKWNGTPIEIMYIDCGRHIEVNEGWYRIFSPYLIPGMSLLIMEDWGTHLQGRASSTIKLIASLRPIQN